ncbi:MAG: PDZ domain-containing protein [Thermoleophilaceae bacterium]|nr:PDZ domain-containing protein [Thermoleophilaceae bacterium]
MKTLVIALFCALIALTGGLYLGGHPDKLPDGVRETFVKEDRATRAEVERAIERSYYKNIKTEDLDEKSLQALVRGLGDRFSHYIPPKEAKLFEQSLSGSFEGIGMTVQEDPKGLEVVSVFPKSPAKKAKLVKGDVITAVDGKSIEGQSTDVATARIKGPAGTKVRITVDGGKGRQRDLTVERAKIDVPVVRGRIEEAGGKKIGVVQLASFSEGVHGLVRKEIDELFDKGAQGIVLDLRGNGGGLLQEGRLVASIFIEDGLIVSTKGRKRSERKFDAVGDAIDEDVPVVVLVDRGTASASEIVTGALRDTGRARVVGEKTFGKGVFQEVEELPNGAVLDLTVGSYYLPKGDNISNKGIAPQVKARDRARTRPDEALPTALQEVVKQL